MQYRKYGKSDLLVSALGFGTMRLPEIQKGKDFSVDMEAAQSILTAAYESGINYFDCGYGYLHGNCESAVGKVLKPFRKEIYLSTKLPPWLIKEPEDFDRILGEQLNRLQTDYIDFYHFHAVNKKHWENTILKLGLIEKMERYKKEGIIRYISFSYHDDIETMKEIIDTGVFSTCLCQYNLIDRSFEEGISYAANKGMGVAVMGPIGGGRLEKGNDQLNRFLTKEEDSLPKLAMRFVLSNPHVSTVLSGMSSLTMLLENVKTVSEFSPLTHEEEAVIKATDEEFKKMAKLYCTGCEYCMPCPQNINIPHLFALMNQHQVYGLTDQAKRGYKEIVEDPNQASADSCVACGNCIKKCPQNIPIINQLKELHEVLK